MADVSQGPGWWIASDGRWYPPESHPDARARAAAAMPPAVPATVPPFVAPSAAPWGAPPGDDQQPASWYPPQGGARRGWSTKAVVAIVVVSVLMVAAGVGIGLAVGGGSNPATPSSTLKAIGLTPSDVAPGTTVSVIPDGTRVGNKADEQTLEICAATFPSESLRVARRQVSGLNTTQHQTFGTEAVQYRDSAATAQAFAELEHALASSPCPPTHVKLPGEPVTTEVLTTPRHPDAGWPTVAGVGRVAFAAIVSQGDASIPTVNVYLRRGPYLLGLYFVPGAQLSVDGQTTISGITALFEHRLAAVSLPG